MNKFDVPSIIRDLPKPSPKPEPADPWHRVDHPKLRGVRTYFRDGLEAVMYAEALGAEHSEDGRSARIEIVDGLPAEWSGLR